MKTYTKSERLSLMRDISTDIDVIQDNLDALKSYYFEKASFGVNIQTDDYKIKGNNDRITCNKDLLVDYLEREQERLQDELIEHMNVLQNEIKPKIHVDVDDQPFT